MGPNEAIAAIFTELQRAQKLHQRPMYTQLEGYAVILEELDEAWDHIKKDEAEEATHEMVQVAAMALRFLIDVGVGS